MAPKPLPELLCLGYRDRRPEFAAAPRRTAGTATVCGHVTIGAQAQLGPGSVVRGDSAEVRIGDDFFLGERATVHVGAGAAPTVIGTGVTVGANAVLRSCHVGDRCVLEHNAVVLDGATLEPGLALEKGALVPAGTVLAGGFLYRGNPARAVRALESGELLLLRGRVRHSPLSDGAGEALALDPRRRALWPGFVALTAQVEGRLDMAPGASIWFGARVDGGHHGIAMGSGSSLQDNCQAYAMSSALQIGNGVTIGHNTGLQDCRIGDHCLIGAAAFVAAGTVIEGDVLLAPGSVTLPRQVLHAGWCWGGRPARALMPMGDEARALVAHAAQVTREHAEGFSVAMADLCALAGNGTA